MLRGLAVCSRGAGAPLSRPQRWRREKPLSTVPVRAWLPLGSSQCLWTVPRLPFSSQSDASNSQSSEHDASNVQSDDETGEYAATREWVPSMRDVYVEPGADIAPIHKGMLDNIIATARWKGEPMLARKMMHNMKRNLGLKPSKLAYHAVMNAFLRKNQFSNVLFTFEEMQKDEIVPDMSMYHLALVCCSKLGKMEEMERLWKQMIIFETPDLKAYNIRIYAESKQRDNAKVFALFREMIAKRMRPDADTFNSMLNSLKDDPEKMLSFIESFEKWGIKPDRHTWVSVLDAYDRLGMGKKRVAEIQRRYKDEGKKDELEELQEALKTYKPFDVLKKSLKEVKTKPLQEKKNMLDNLTQIIKSANQGQARTGVHTED